MTGLVWGFVGRERERRIEDNQIDLVAQLLVAGVYVSVCMSVLLLASRLPDCQMTTSTQTVG